MNRRYFFKALANGLVAATSADLFLPKLIKPAWKPILAITGPAGIGPHGAFQYSVDSEDFRDQNGFVTMRVINGVKLTVAFSGRNPPAVAPGQTVKIFGSFLNTSVAVTEVKRRGRELEISGWEVKPGSMIDGMLAGRIKSVYGSG